MEQIMLLHFIYSLSDRSVNLMKIYKKIYLVFSVKFHHQSVLTVRKVFVLEH